MTYPPVPKLICGRRERGAGHCSGAAMIDAQPIGQKWRSNGNEMPIAHIGVDIMVLSVLFPNRELDKWDKYGPDSGARNALNVGRLLAPVFASHGERGWVIAQVIYHDIPAIWVRCLCCAANATRDVRWLPLYFDRSAWQTQYYHKHHTDKSIMKLSRASASYES